MSQRRKPGDVVKRSPGSGFISSGASQSSRTSEYILIPPTEDAPDICLLGCGDPECQEWPNLLIVEGPETGEYLYHISECQMHDPSSEMILKHSKNPEQRLYQKMYLVVSSAAVAGTIEIEGLFSTPEKAEQARQILVDREVKDWKTDTFGVETTREYWLPKIRVREIDLDKLE